MCKNLIMDPAKLMKVSLEGNFKNSITRKRWLGTARGVAVAVAKRFLKPQPYLMKEVRAPAEDPRKSAIYWPFAVSDNIPPKKKRTKRKSSPNAATPLCFPLPFCDQLSVCPRDLWFCLERAAKKSGQKSELILSLV